MTTVLLLAFPFFVNDPNGFFFKSITSFHGWNLDIKVASENVFFCVFSILLYGVIISISQGMIIKVLPFLSYTHLQKVCLTNFSAMQYLPNMH